MVRKIVSGGQTGADRAALDVAMDFGIAYGGWVPRGRKTEAGPLPEKYAHMQESASRRYGERTLRNVVESDGTLIISRGKLTGGSRLTADIARQYGRPCLHVDLSATFRFKAAEVVRSWIIDQRVEVLNVAGPRASSDPEIYQTVYDILQTAFFMDMALSSRPGGFFHYGPAPRPPVRRHGPETIQAAVEGLMDELSLRDKATMARLSASDLGAVVASLSHLMKEKGVWPPENPELLAALRDAAGPVTPEEAPGVLVTALWEAVRVTHAIRRVK